MIHKLEDFENWADMKNCIICADALELMQKIPDKSIDLFLIDPPYILSDSDPGKQKNLSSLEKFKSSAYKNIINGFDIDVYFSEFNRVLKKFNMFCFCSNKQISSIMNWGEKRGYSTTLLIWNKINSVPFANGVWRGDIEYIVHIRESGAVFVGDAKLKEKVFKSPYVNNTRHPTEKPIGLIRKYIEIGSIKNDLVLDVFSGSFTTAKACQELGRDFIGCDQIFNYCEIGEQRLNEVPLFTV